MNPSFCVCQSFTELQHRPLLVDLTVEEGQRLKVIYGSCSGFHAVDVDSGAVYDIYLPTHVSARPRRSSYLCFSHPSLSFSNASSSPPPLRSRPAFSATPSSSCQTALGRRFWFATKTRASTLTPTAASPRIQCCSGGRCLHQSVCFIPHTQT